jgi:hypothetical protein
MKSQLQHWVMLEILRARSPADKGHRSRTKIGDATVYLCRTADDSDTMALRVEADGAWCLHTSRCVIWDDGTHRAIGDLHIERDHYCSDAIEALSCYYDASEIEGMS